LEKYTYLLLSGFGKPFQKFFSGLLRDDGSILAGMVIHFLQNFKSKERSSFPAVNRLYLPGVDHETYSRKRFKYI